MSPRGREGGFLKLKSGRLVTMNATRLEKVPRISTISVDSSLVARRRAFSACRMSQSQVPEALSLTYIRISPWRATRCTSCNYQNTLGCFEFRNAMKRIGYHKSRKYCCMSKHHAADQLSQTTEEDKLLRTFCGSVVVAAHASPVWLGRIRSIFISSSFDGEVGLVRRWSVHDSHNRGVRDEKKQHYYSQTL